MITHLKIRQASDRTESVPVDVINKLYELSFHSDDVQRQLDSTSYLSGKINTILSTHQKIDFLNSEWGPGLIVSATTYSISFEDPEWEQICINTWGANGGIVESQLRNVTNLKSTLAQNNSNLRIVDLKYSTFAGNPFSDSNVFTNCPNIEKVIIGYVKQSGNNKIMSINTLIDRFGRSGINKIIINKADRIFGDGAGGGTRTVNILAVKHLYGDISNYLTRSFSTIDNLYLGSSTPVAMSKGYGDNFNKIKAVYVPTGCSNAYLASTDFNQYWDMAYLQSVLHEYDFEEDPDHIFSDIDVEP